MVYLWVGEGKVISILSNWHAGVVGVAKTGSDEHA